MRGDWWLKLVEERGMEGARAEMRRRRSLRKSKIGGFSLMTREQLQEFGRANGSNSKRGKARNETNGKNRQSRPTIQSLDKK